MNFLLSRGMSRKNSIKSSSIMSCDSSSSSSSSSSGCCSNLSSSTAQVSGGEEVTSSSGNKSIPCHLKGGVGSDVTSAVNYFPDHHPYTDLNSYHNHGQESSCSPSRSPSIPSSSNGSISSSTYLAHSGIEFGPMGTIKRKSPASTHLNGPVLPLTSITRALAIHSDEACLVELDDGVIKANSGADIGAANGNVLNQSNVQYGTLKMRRSFRSKEGCSNVYQPSYNNYSNGYNRPFINHRSSHLTDSDGSSLASHPVNEEDEEELMMKRMNRDLNGSSSAGNFSVQDQRDEDGQADNLPLPPPPPETNLTQSLSTLSLISLPPPPPEFCCNTLDTNTLSSVSSSSPSSSSSPPSTATHSLERSCCNGTDPSRDNTLTRTNVRLHQRQQKSCNSKKGYPGSHNHPVNRGAVGSNHACSPHRVSSISPSSSSSFDEDISCDGQGCTECREIEQYSKQKLHDSKYQLMKVNGQTPGCSKQGAVGGRGVPVTRSASCYARQVGVKQKYIRAGSRDDSSSVPSSHIHPSHLNPCRPNELINARRYKPMYSSSSSCSSRDGDDQSCSLRECQSPEDVMIQRLESVENVNSTFNSSPSISHPHHKNLAKARMSAKITGLNRSDQPIYDSVFTFRKQAQSQDICNPVINETNQSSLNHAGGCKDFSELPPPPPELMGEQIPNHGNQQISFSSPMNQVTYGVVNKGNKNGPDSSFHHPVPNRSPMKGPLPTAPEEFVRNLHRVMEKKWKVAQTLSGDFSEEQILTSSFHPRSSLGRDQFASSNVMGFRDSSSPLPPPSPPSHHGPLPPPPPSHYQYPNSHQVMIDSSPHVPAPPKLTCLQYQGSQYQHPINNKFHPPPPSRTDTSFYDVLPVSVRPFNRAINQVGNGESSNPVIGSNGHSFQNGKQYPSSGESSSPGINQHRNHPGNGSPSSLGIFSRMIPFRRSSKVSSVCSSKSSSSNHSSSSSSGSKGAPPPPPKRSDKTKLSYP